MLGKNIFERAGRKDLEYFIGLVAPEDFENERKGSVRLICAEVPSTITGSVDFTPTGTFRQMPVCNPFLSERDQV